MKTTKKLVLEIKRLNNKLDLLTNNSRYLVYNANPLKFAWYNFIAGVFHSLGSLFGTAVIAAAIVYLASTFDIQSFISQFIQNTLMQVRWDQIVPTPSLNQFR